MALGVDPAQLRKALELVRENWGEETQGDEAPRTPRGIWTWDSDSEGDSHELLDLDDFMASEAPEEPSEEATSSTEEATSSVLEALEAAAEEGEEEASWSDVWTWEDLESSCRDLDAKGLGKVACIDLTHLVLQCEMLTSSPASQSQNRSHHAPRSAVGSPGKIRVSRAKSLRRPFQDCATQRSSPLMCHSPSLGAVPKCSATSRFNRTGLGEE